MNSIDKAIKALESVLCDPDGNCCIRGSKDDRIIVDEALADLKAHKESNTWQDIATAPKDGTKFIGLMEFGLVFTTHRQAIHTYKEKGLGFHPTKMDYCWSYEDGDSHNPCRPPHWMPLPAINVIKGVDDADK